MEVKIQGTICFKTNVKTPDVDKFFTGLDKMKPDISWRKEGPTPFSISIKGYDSYFWYSPLVELLGSIKGYIEEPSYVSFYDEKCGFWRLRFDEYTGEWVDEDGTVTYTADDDKTVIAKALRLYASQGDDERRAAEKAAMALDVPLD